ncbi:inositol monophosphatase family protein [Saccharothrix lopnurensis]|uniref:inositol-phosphate phosphatase n=1 Tax=Saccharothrix lopnurensis TaxID=1670621 RepID=A0ABW1P9K8_9PSEU
MKQPLNQVAEIAQKAVAIANDLIRTSRPQIITEKSDRDTYTDIDLTIERSIRTFLAEATPELSFYGEEESYNEESLLDGATWVLDPVDGTSNYVHGIPLCAVSLALVIDGKCELASISLPFTNLHYRAIKGEGAYVNNHKIQVSDTRSLRSAIISIGDYATGAESEEKNRSRIAITAALADSAERVRMFGSAAHDFTWTAEGRIDATVILSNKVWDVASGALIASEAGAVLLDKNGQPYSNASKSVVAVTPGIASELMGLLAGIE